jgi:hypothetical protein
MKKTIVSILFMLIAIVSLSHAAEQSRGETCLSCHKKETPAVVEYWSGSAHAENGIECGECHFDDYFESHIQGKERKAVEAHVCAKCHSDRAKEHFTGKHGIGFRAGRACTRNEEKTPAILSGCNDCHEKGSALPRQDAECARFLAQTPEMQRQGCLACHNIENRCDACHTSHGTDLYMVRDPAVCATCHMGPDHPQYEMWMTSKHGIMFNQKGSTYAPDCNTCHLPDGNHNVSHGISMGLAGQEYENEMREMQRGKMLDICEKCHTRKFGARSLEDGDAIQRQSIAMVEEAASIITELEKEGLLMPSPADRPPHPLSGQKLEIGPQMLYEDISRIEAVFFRMKKFYYVTAYKGVFHQSPDYAHWYGNAPLKLALSEIRSEALLLREVGRLKARLDNLSEGQTVLVPESDKPDDSLRGNLRMLKDLYLKGDLSEEEYEKRKSGLLDRHGL